MTNQDPTIVEIAAAPNAEMRRPAESVVQGGSKDEIGKSTDGADKSTVEAKEAIKDESRDIRSASWIPTTWLTNAWRTINNNAGPIRAVTLAVILLLMTTGPAAYISVVAADRAAGGSYLSSPDSLMRFIFSYATTKSDIFNLFNIIAVPTITAYFGVSDNKNYAGGLAWLVFLYLISVFILSYIPEVLNSDAYKTLWADPLTTIKVDAVLIDQYIKNVRNGALTAIAVMAGIKLAKQ